MKVLVCGSRNWHVKDRICICARIDELPDDTIVITGAAAGVDASAEWHARRRGLFVATMPVSKAHWERYGKAAGPMRNHAMLDLGPDLVIAFQRDASKGTQSTIDEARRRGIPVEVHTA